MHVALGELLETHLVRGFYSEKIILLLKITSQVFDLLAQSCVILSQPLTVCVQFPDLES